MLSLRRLFHPAPAFCAALLMSVLAALLPLENARASDAGVVILHGKGGMPGGLVRPLAEYLTAEGFAVANLEMPWSKSRQYNAAPETAVAEIDAAVAKMKAEGARRTFVAGHSLGGLFAAYYATQRPLSGLILVAPGGNVASKFWQKKVASSLEEATVLIADGKGDAPGDFLDFEGSKGEFTIRVTARFYRAWFSLDSPLNQRRTYGRLPPDLPILNIVPLDDYKALRKTKDELYALLPVTADTEMYEPDTDHKGAPGAAAAYIKGWIDKLPAR